MRALFAFALTFGLSLAFAQAQPVDPPDHPWALRGSDAPQAAPPSVPSPLDLAFDELKREASAPRAEAIASRIQAQWLSSGSATVDLLVRWAGQAALDGRHGAAFDLFDQALLLAPDHAAIWNARATLNYQLEAYGRSIADIEETLRREPRHFGALTGLGAILEEVGRDGAALRAYRRALEVYPALREAQEGAARVSARIRGTNL